MKMEGKPMGLPSLAGTDAPCELPSFIDRPFKVTVWPLNLCHQFVIVQ